MGGGKKKKNGENKMSLQEFFKQTPMPVRASGILHGRDGGGQEFDNGSSDGANAATNTGSGKKKTNTKGSPFRGNDSASFINNTIDFRVGFKVLQLNEKSNSNVGEMFVH